MKPFAIIPNIKFKTKCYSASVSVAGGAILAFEQMQSEEKDGSISATLWDLVNLGWDASIPTPSEFKALFTKHGFDEIKFTYTQDWDEYDIIYAIKAKK